MKNPVTGKEISGLCPGDFGDKPLRLSQFVEMVKCIQKMYGNRDPFVGFSTPFYGEVFTPNGFWDVDDWDCGYLVLEDNTGVKYENLARFGNDNPENLKGFIRKPKTAKKAKKTAKKQG